MRDYNKLLHIFFLHQYVDSTDKDQETDNANIRNTFASNKGKHFNKIKKKSKKKFGEVCHFSPMKSFLCLIFGDVNLNVLINKFYG